MKVKIAERHTAQSDALRAYVVEKTEVLERYFDRIISVDVILSVEKGRQIADFHTHLTNRKIIKAHEESPDMYTSIDKAIDRLKRQLVKYKDHLKETRHHRRIGESSKAASVAGKVDHKEILRTDIHFHKPMTPEEAALQLDAVKKGFLVFINSATDQVSIIYHRRNGHYGLIEPRR